MSEPQLSHQQHTFHTRTSQENLVLFSTLTKTILFFPYCTFSPISYYLNQHCSIQLTYPTQRSGTSRITTFMHYHIHKRNYHIISTRSFVQAQYQSTRIYPISKYTSHTPLEIHPTM